MIDTARDGVAATIDISLTPAAREGAMPDGLTVSPDGKTLYVALGGENALAVVDVAQRRVKGFIPTAWYPVDVDIDRHGRRLIVTGQNRVGDRPNRCAGPYAVGECSSGDVIYADAAADSTQTMTKGVINQIAVPGRERLAQLTAQVMRNNRVKARKTRKPSYLKAIKHVIYVVKENRTYDRCWARTGRGRATRR